MQQKYNERMHELESKEAELKNSEKIIYQENEVLKADKDQLVSEKEGDRITCAGAVFRTSMNPNISKRLGTRHRAALGIAEESDAIALVVSEETGRLSIAVEGNLHYNLDSDQFRMMLIDELKPKMEVFFEADESDGEDE